MKIPAWHWKSMGIAALIASGSLAMAATAVPGKIEAESYSNMAGVQLEACSEGTQNVGWIDNGDWMVYPITVPSAGSYTIQYRVASPYATAVVSADLNAGATQLGTVAVPNTGGWQNWTTISQTVTLPAGTINLGVNARAGGFNLNWINILSNGGTSTTPTNSITINGNAAYEGWLKAYLVRSNGQTYFANSLTDRSRAFFWGQAYLITTVEDACDRSPTAERKQLVTDLLDTLLVNETKDWKWDTWNDDVEWAIIACIRGYRITGKQAYLDAASNNFKMVWNRGWDSTFDGGIWELMDDRLTSSGNKGGLSNWPFIIAGCMIYEATKDGWYRDRCVDVYNWARTHCFDPSSGRVYEGTGYKGLFGDDNSYNSGLLVNACNSLYKITGNPQCYNDAIKAADHYIGRIGGLASGIMSEDHPMNGDFGCDQFARGLAKLAAQNNLWSKYGPFLANNCAAAWKHRRTDYNVSMNDFSKETITGNLNAMEVQGSVTLPMVTLEGGAPATLPEGTYKIVSRENGSVLDVARQETANNSALDVWPYNGGSNQRWILTSIGNGYYKIVGEGSGRSLNVGSASAEDNAAVIIYDFQNTPNEIVYLSSPEPGYYVIHFMHSGKVMDVNRGTQGVIQWEYNGGRNQQWQFLIP